MPLHKAAMGILDAAYSPEKSPGFDAGQRADLLPILTDDCPIERVCHITLVREKIKIGTTEATVDTLANMFKTLNLTELAGAHAGSPIVTFGALLTLSDSVYTQGVTLGNQLHGVSPTPYESPRIAFTDWTWKSSAGQMEKTLFREGLAGTSTLAITRVQSGADHYFEDPTMLLPGMRFPTSTALSRQGYQSLFLLLLFLTYALWSECQWPVISIDHPRHEKAVVTHWPSDTHHP